VLFAGCAASLVLPAIDAGFAHGTDGFGNTSNPPNARNAAHAGALMP